MGCLCLCCSSFPIRVWSLGHWRGKLELLHVVCRVSPWGGGARKGTGHARRPRSGAEQPAEQTRREEEGTAPDGPPTHFTQNPHVRKTPWLREHEHANSPETGCALPSLAGGPTCHLRRKPAALHSVGCFWRARQYSMLAVGSFFVPPILFLAISAHFCHLHTPYAVFCSILMLAAISIYCHEPFPSCPQFRYFPWSFGVAPR